jgi:hypothetical protein
VVEHLTDNPNIMGSNPATVMKEKKVGKQIVRIVTTVVSLETLEAKN